MTVTISDSKEPQKGTPKPVKSRASGVTLSSIIGALPYFVFIAAFLIVPIIANVFTAFKDAMGNPSTQLVQPTGELSC